ncbi:hypothetical protein Q5H92_15460 [Hymenobacter sp. M29]|uniref:DUF4369 domain-containing protein n=1 Tax=Hymenobacter mellowenesis TaxID=3063995 RepID=A0ABT9AD55_9BACT|nr:hypothetical protein [Hymenobacter sp. M29]MDO7847765.1 hypothetical protein [Hymenobacter sp. M29]
MKAWLIGCWLLAAGPAVAQFNKGVHLQFQFSRVVLASGDTLAGPLAVQFSTDLLYLGQPDGSVRTFVPAAVAAFAVQGQAPLRVHSAKSGMATFDPTVVRLFRTLPWPSERPDRRAEPAFFEQLSEGPVLLLRRQSYVPRTVAFPAEGSNRQFPVGSARQPAHTPAAFRTLTELKDEFYLAWASGEIRPLHHGKKDLLAAFPAHSSQLQAYAKAHGLGYHSAAELHDLVSYVNTLAGAAQ